jgi:membrane-bound lytic murein transglycosylase MltF
MRRIAFYAVAGALGLALASPAFPADPPPKPRALPLEHKPWQGDFDAMVERRIVRVVVPYSRSLYFNDKGRERGLTADFVRDFERYVNRKLGQKLGKRPITVYIIPVTRDALLEAVVAGKADIAAGNLTATETRRKIVDFVVLDDGKPTTELVLTGPKSAPVASAEDLSGRTVHVRKASSYYESLLALNERLAKAGRAPAKLVLVPDALEDEDIMEMLNAGLLEAIVVDAWKARMWAQVLPKITVNEGAAVRAEGHVGWAFRKGSPQLETMLTEFLHEFVKKQNLRVARLRQYHARVKQLKDPTGSAEWKRFEEMLALFERYGAKYQFDPLMLATQGYQESQLNQAAKSHVGAIGVMQVMPATGAALKVGDITQVEPNIHAGAKYMDQLMTRYFKDANFTDANRTLFAFASYNAGPGRIAGLRKEAAARGLDPDKWFNNVELVAAEKVGMEVTTYVRNIYKYYAAYRLALEVRDAQRKAAETVQPASK